MNTNAPTMGTGEDVVSAFEMLLEEIEAEIDLINAVGTKAMDSRDYIRARAAIGRAENLNTFRNKVAGLREGWEELFEQPRKQEDPAIKAERQAIARTVTGRLPRGLRTPEPFFRIPILRALAAMPNGGGKMNEVLDRVEALVKPRSRQSTTTDSPPPTPSAGETPPSGPAKPSSTTASCAPTHPMALGRSPMPAAST